MNLDAVVESGQLSIVQIDPAEMGPGEFVANVGHAVSNWKQQRPRPRHFRARLGRYLIATTSTLPRLFMTLIATSWSERSNRRSMVAAPTSR